MTVMALHLTDKNSIYHMYFTYKPYKYYTLVSQSSKILMGDS